MLIRRARKASCRQPRNTQVIRFTRLLPHLLETQRLKSEYRIQFCEQVADKLHTIVPVWVKETNGGSNGDTCELIKKYQRQRFLLM